MGSGGEGGAGTAEGGAVGAGEVTVSIASQTLQLRLRDAGRTLPALEEAFELLPIADAARAAFAARELTADEARRLAHGQRLDASELGPGPVAAYAPDGTLVALIADAGLTARPLVVLAGQP